MRKTAFCSWKDELGNFGLRNNFLNVHQVNIHCPKGAQMSLPWVALKLGSREKRSEV